MRPRTGVPDLRDAQPGEETDERPHHTAIIVTAPGSGALTVLEQNHRGNHEKLRMTAMRFLGKPEETTRVRKPMQREGNGKTEIATVITTTAVSIRGTRTAYRPKAK